MLPSSIQPIPPNILRSVSPGSASSRARTRSASSSLYATELIVILLSDSKKEGREQGRPAMLGDSKAFSGFAVDDLEKAKAFYRTRSA